MVTNKRIEGMGVQHAVVVLAAQSLNFAKCLQRHKEFLMSLELQDVDQRWQADQLIADADELMLNAYDVKDVPITGRKYYGNEI